MHTPYRHSGDLIGRVIGGRYRPLERIGAGGFGEVYRAHPVGFEELQVAVKVLHRHVAEENDAQSRTRREAASLARLRSRHVVRAIDLGATDDGRPYVVMEFVRGRTLTSILDEHGHLDDATVRAIAIDVGLALIDAHAEGIVHLDLKPSNVMLVNERGQPMPMARVLDFGVARMLDAVDEDDEPMLTPRYAAPEHLRGRPEPRSDVYALGVLMATMLEGRHPHEVMGLPPGDDGRATNEPLRFGPRVKASPLAEIVTLACRKPLAERFASADDLVAALRDVDVAAAPSLIAVDGPAQSTDNTLRTLTRTLTTVPGPTPAPAAASAKPRRKGQRAAAVAVAAVVVVGISSWAAWGGSIDPGAPPESMSIESRAPTEPEPRLPASPAPAPTEPVPDPATEEAPLADGHPAGLVAGEPSEPVASSDGRRAPAQGGEPAEPRRDDQGEEAADDQTVSPTVESRAEPSSEPGGHRTRAEDEPSTEGEAVPEPAGESPTPVTDPTTDPTVPTATSVTENPPGREADAPTVGSDAAPSLGPPPGLLTR